MTPQLLIVLAFALIAIVGVHLWHVKHPRIIEKVKVHAIKYPDLDPDRIYCDFCICHVARFRRLPDSRILCANCEQDGKHQRELN